MIWSCLSLSYERYVSKISVLIIFFLYKLTKAKVWLIISNNIFNRAFSHNRFSEHLNNVRWSSKYGGAGSISENSSRARIHKRFVFLRVQYLFQITENGNKSELWINKNAKCIRIFCKKREFFQNFSLCLKLHTTVLTILWKTICLECWSI